MKDLQCFWDQEPPVTLQVQGKRTMMRINEVNSDGGHDLGGGYGLVTFKG